MTGRGAKMGADGGDDACRFDGQWLASGARGRWLSDRIEAPRASDLGFVTDASLDALIREHIEATEGGPRVAERD